MLRNVLLEESGGADGEVEEEGWESRMRGMKSNVEG